MKNSIKKRIGLLSLTIVAAVSLWHAFVVEQEKEKLSQAYGQAQELVSQLTEERTHLNAELQGVSETVSSQATDLSTLQQELKNVQDRLDETVDEIASLQREQGTLRRENRTLVAKLNLVMQEKEHLQQRLSSLKELKLAVREVKQRMRHERWAAWRARMNARIDTLKEGDEQQLASGNNGFVVRNGHTTLGADAAVRVHVLDPQPQ